VIKRFKFLVIILVSSIYSISICGDFPKILKDGIRTHVDFSNLTPDQEVCYLPQIHKEVRLWLPIDYACFKGNVSAFKWLLSKGVVPNQECFKSAILSDNNKSEIVSELLLCGLYNEYICEIKTLQMVQNRLAWLSDLATKDPDSFASSLAEAQKIYVMIKLYEDEVGLRTAWEGAVAIAGLPYKGAGSRSAGAKYAGAGSGACVFQDRVEIEE
jgi:hypothetical protein